MDTLEKEFKDGCKELLKENISMVDTELKKNPAHLFYRGKRIDFSSVKSLADHWTGRLNENTRPKSKQSSKCL